MAEFASLQSYARFEQGARAKASIVTEFVHGGEDEAVREFLGAVLETSRSHLIQLKTNKRLFRAQLAFSKRTESIDHGGGAPAIEVETACSADRMLPQAEFVGDGRANRNAFPVLYLADNPKTAMAEMRPWVGSYITVAEFKVIRDCWVVDCSSNSTRSVYLEVVVDLDPSAEPTTPDAATKEKGVWGDIGSAFSTPVTRGEPDLNYLPTQVLAEAFRSHGHDGVMYRSLLDEGGNNLALFDRDSATQVRRCLYKVRRSSWEFVRNDDDLSWPDALKARYECRD